MQPIRNQGQALPEYGLIGGLILLCCIGFIAVLGQNVNNVFKNMLHSKTTNMVTLSNGGMPGSASESAVSEDGSLLKNQPGTQASDDLTFTNIAKPQQTLADLQNSQNEPVQSAGSLGIQQQVYADSQTIQNIANLLSHDPNAHPGLVDMLTKLANQGHAIGDKMGTVIDATAAANTEAGSASYNPESLTLLEDVKTTSLGLGESGSDFAFQWALVQEFLARNPAALPPNVESNLNNAVSGIENALVTFNPETSDPVQVQGNANTICANGGDTKQCSQ